MVKYFAILLIVAGLIGCASDVQPESISAEKAQAAQSKFETSSQGAEAGGAGAGPEAPAASDQ
jgi:hypothetical protein